MSNHFPLPPIPSSHRTPTLSLSLPLLLHMYTKPFSPINVNKVQFSEVTLHHIPLHSPLPLPFSLPPLPLPCGTMLHTLKTHHGDQVSTCVCPTHQNNTLLSLLQILKMAQANMHRCETRHKHKTAKHKKDTLPTEVRNQYDIIMLPADNISNITT